jgi:hypothetical protein
MVMKLLIAGCATAMGAVTMLGGPAIAHGAAAPAAAPRAEPAAAARACDLDWTHAPQHAGTMVASKISQVSAGQHACFDRLVIRLGRGKRPGYRVRYVQKIVQDGSGETIPVKGRGKLLISALAPATRHFPVSSRHLADVTGFRSFRQVVCAGSFEGITSFGVGVRAKKLPFRVFTLRGPGTGTRLVVDVAHHR